MAADSLNPLPSRRKVLCGSVSTVAGALASHALASDDSGICQSLRARWEGAIEKWKIVSAESDRVLLELASQGEFKNASAAHKASPQYRENEAAWSAIIAIESEIVKLDSVSLHAISLKLDVFDFGEYGDDDANQVVQSIRKSIANHQNNA